MNTNKKISIIVAGLRKAQGLPRRALSEQTGISERYLAQLEANKANISVGLLDKIAKALGVETVDLMRFEKPDEINKNKFNAIVMAMLNTDKNELEQAGVIGINQAGGNDWSRFVVNPLKFIAKMNVREYERFWVMITAKTSN